MMNKKGYGTKKEIRKVANEIWDQLKFSGSYLFPNSQVSRA